MNDDCIFCKIVRKEIPSEFFFENENAVVFPDIKPKAPIHFLIVPKKHIDSVNDLEVKDKDLIGELVLIAKNVAQDLKLNGYKLKINVGREGGQEIDHLHLHLLSGN